MQTQIQTPAKSQCPKIQGCHFNHSISNSKRILLHFLSAVQLPFPNEFPVSFHFLKHNYHGCLRYLLFSLQSYESNTSSWSFLLFTSSQILTQFQLDDNAESLMSLNNRRSKARAMCIHISKLLTYTVVVRASSQD